MKARRIFAILMLCCFVLTTAAFATDGTETGTETEAITETEPEEDTTGTDAGSGSSSVNSTTIINQYEDNGPDYSTYVSMADSGASDSGLSLYLSELFGEYTPQKQFVTQTYPDGSVISYEEYVSGLAGLDWEWLTGVGLFSMVLYSFFRILGVFFSGR